EVGQSSRDREALLSDLHTRAADLHATSCITAQDRGEQMKPQSFGATGGYRAETPQMLNCLNQRFIASITAIHRLAEAQVDVPGRVTLIWIGPGWPLLTNRSFPPAPPKVKKNFFDQLVLLSPSLREAQVTVDAVASPEDLPYPEAPADSAFFDGVSTDDQV